MNKIILFNFFLFLVGSAICADEPPSNFLSLAEAISTTLHYQKQIFIRDQEVIAQAGLLRQAAGPFDPLVSTQGVENYQELDVSALLGAVPPIKLKMNAKINTAQANLNISKTFRVGTNAMFSTQVGRVYIEAKPPKIQENDPLVQINFQIDQPLLRNFLTGQNMANEQAKKFDVLSAWYSAAFFVTSAINTTVVDYWEVLANKKLLEIQRNAERYFIDLVQKTKELIKAQVLAPADLNQSLAQLATKKVDVLLAEQQYYISIQNLKFDMGIGDQCTPFEKDVKTEEFPETTKGISLKDANCDTLLNIIEKLSLNRWDIIASKLTGEGINWRLTGNKNAALPQLDLFGSVNYQKMPSLSGPPPEILKTRQVTVMGGITFSSPLYNDAALGLVQQTRAQLAQNDLQTMLLKEQAASQFFETLKTHYYLISELQESRIAVERNRLLVANELKKLDAGYSTIFFVIDYQNQLTDSLSRQVLLEKTYAQNIVNFRFITGTLVNFNRLKNEFFIEPVFKWPENF